MQGAIQVLTLAAEGRQEAAWARFLELVDEMRAETTDFPDRAWALMSGGLLNLCTLLLDHAAITAGQTKQSVLQQIGMQLAKDESGL